MKRRTFLQSLMVMGAASAARPSRAGDESDGDGNAILVDLTRCEGCRSCEAACAEANGLPEPDWEIDIDEMEPRPTTEKQWVTVSRFDTSRGDVYVRRQCMHCLQPACAAGCLTKALVRKPEGAVVWRGDKCMGCRYCMISCPFDVPKFEYDSANPRIQKCRMCWERVEAGELPACVDECPGDALSFGPRAEMIELARKRIYENPGKYVSEIYGEHEVGGTGWLYISPVPFAELGFPTNLGETPVPEYTRDFLTAVPVILAIWPALLLGIRRATHPEDSEADVAVDEH